MYQTSSNSSPIRGNSFTIFCECSKFEYRVRAQYGNRETKVSRTSKSSGFLTISMYELFTFFFFIYTSIIFILVCISSRFFHYYYYYYSHVYTAHYGCAEFYRKCFSFRLYNNISYTSNDFYYTIKCLNSARIWHTTIRLSDGISYFLQS